MPLTCSRILWVSLMIDEICAQHRVTDVRKMIREDRLPKDPHGLYELALDRIEETGCQGYAAKMFKVIAAARRPMTLCELAEAVVIEPCQSSWSAEDRIAMPEEMMSWVANLLVLDEEERSLSFTHHSVIHFLSTTKSTAYKFSLQEADLGLGDICVTYLNFRELQGQLVLQQDLPADLLWRPTDAEPLNIASRALSNSALNQSWAKLLTNIARKVQFSRSDTQAPSSSPTVTLVKTFEAELRHLKHTFYFLVYASEFWLDHAATYGVNYGSQSWDLWGKLLKSPNFAASKPGNQSLGMRVFAACNTRLTRDIRLFSWNYGIENAAITTG